MPLFDCVTTFGSHVAPVAEIASSAQDSCGIQTNIIIKGHGPIHVPGKFQPRGGVTISPTRTRTTTEHAVRALKKIATPAPQCLAPWYASRSAAVKSAPDRGCHNAHEVHIVKDGAGCYAASCPTEDGNPMMMG